MNGGDGKADLQVILDYLRSIDGKVDTLSTRVQALEQKVGGLDPLFREELAALEARINQKIEDLEVNWNTRFLEFEHRNETWQHEVEGRIIATVYRLGESGIQRLTAAERETAAIKERLATLEERLVSIEKRLETLPPRPQA